MAEDQLKKYLLFAEILANYQKIAIFFSECVFGLFEQFRNFFKISIQVLATPYMESVLRNTGRGRLSELSARAAQAAGSYPPSNS